MNVELNWRGGMALEGSNDQHKVMVDAKSPIGKDSAMTPKELLLVAMGGCTAMDVLALLHKWKFKPESLKIVVSATPSEGVSPAVFESANLRYDCSGDIDPEKLREAVRLSQSKYCGVSAMLNSAFPIHYKINLNGKEIGDGLADFN